MFETLNALDFSTLFHGLARLGLQDEDVLDACAEGLLLRRDMFGAQAQAKHVFNVLYALGKLSYRHQQVMDYLAGEVLAR